MAASLTLSVVIVTYGREQVLLDTIEQLLPQIDQTAGALELLVIDQTADHLPETQAALSQWAEHHQIRWLRLPEPQLTHAMNLGLLEAKGEVVLYVDDDIRPQPNLLQNHLAVYDRKPEVWAVVGQVIQPGEQPEALSYQPKGNFLFRYMDFPFRSTIPGYIENAMAGNLSVRRSRALELGGFDEQFIPPVAARFESEFAKRLVRAGGRIWFEPSASIHHLAAPSGGIRSRGSHLSSALPIFGIGDYYFALRQGRGWERFWYILRKPFREVRTRFHLHHPWWIPPKLLGEVRAFIGALRLYRAGPKLLDRSSSGKRSWPS